MFQLQQQPERRSVQERRVLAVEVGREEAFLDGWVAACFSALVILYQHSPAESHCENDCVVFFIAKITLESPPVTKM